MAPTTSVTAQDLPRSGIRAIAELARDRDDLVNLVLGEPDFPTPAHIAAAGAAAIHRGATRYAPGCGITELREAAAEAVTARASRTVSAHEVVVTSGGVQGVFGALAALVERGDRVLVPDPGWPSYAGQCRLLGIVPVPYLLEAAAGFEPDMARLERLAAEPSTRALVINTPANPTGAVWPAASIAQCVELAARHDLWVISDEVYDEMAFDARHVGAATFDAERVVTIYSFSKTYAMTGWRVGYLTAPADVASLITKILELEAACAPTPAQHAALAALTGSQRCVAAMRSAYRSRRNVATSALDAEGLTVCTPRGAFYALADVSAATSDDALAARALALLPEGVACAPGSAFGAGGAGLVRLSLAADESDVLEGVRRLGAAVRRWVEIGSVTSVHGDSVA